MPAHPTSIRGSLLRRRSLYTLLVALTVATVAPGASRPRQAPQQDTVRDFNQAHSSIVSIIGEDSRGQPVANGSGFFVTNNVIVTDYRVIKDAIKINATAESGESLNARIVAVDAGRLVALLVVRGAKSPHLELSCSDELKAGERAYSIEAGVASSSPVTVTGEATARGAKLSELDNALSPSGFGSPVLDEQGRVRGVVLKSMDAARSLSVVVGARVIAWLLHTSCDTLQLARMPGDVPGREPAGIAGGVPGGVPGDIQGGVARVPNSGSSELPRIVRKSGGVMQGSALRRAEPLYPPLAKAARVSGAVVVEVTVDEEGDVVSARAVSGHPLLKDPAVDAARGWKFSPTLLAGEPVRVIGTITFNFSLDDGPPGVGSAVINRNEGPTPQTGVDRKPRALDYPQPHYTSAAQANRVEGSRRPGS